MQVEAIGSLQSIHLSQHLQTVSSKVFQAMQSTEQIRAMFQDARWNIICNWTKHLTLKRILKLTPVFKMELAIEIWWWYWSAHPPYLLLKIASKATYCIILEFRQLLIILALLVSFEMLVASYRNWAIQFIACLWWYYKLHVNGILQDSVCSFGLQDPFLCSVI